MNQNLDEINPFETYSGKDVPSKAEKKVIDEKIKELQAEMKAMSVVSLGSTYDKSVKLFKGKQETKDTKWIMKKNDDGSYKYIRLFNGKWAECGFQIPKWSKNKVHCMYLKYNGKYIKDKMLYDEVKDLTDKLAHQHLHSLADALLGRELSNEVYKKNNDGKECKAPYFIELKPLKKIEETEFNILDD